MREDGDIWLGDKQTLEIICDDACKICICCDCISCIGVAVAEVVVIVILEPLSAERLLTNVGGLDFRDICEC